MNVMPARSPLPDALRRARLRPFLDREDHEGAWWGITMSECGKPLVAASVGVGYLPSKDRRDWARMVAEGLNRHAHFNGAWTVVWFKGNRRFAFVWKDWDGDLQIFGDDTAPFSEIGRLPLVHWVEHGYTMIETWLRKMRQDVEIQATQTIKLAQGERTPFALAPNMGPDLNTAAG